MSRYYIKKGDLYLHVGTVTYEEYQDYSDIDAMHMTQYRFLKQKMVLKTFLVEMKLIHIGSSVRYAGPKLFTKALRVIVKPSQNHRVVCNTLGFIHTVNDTTSIDIIFSTDRYNLKVCGQ